MKFYLSALFLAILFVSGCKEETCYEEKGLFTLEEYFERNPGLDLTEDPTGLFYTINDPGGELKPVATADITAAYVGEHVTGEVFDQRPDSIPLVINLTRLIPAWQIGLRKIGAGGNITLYVPSELGYGARGAGNDICPNSDLIFNLELISFTQ